MSQHPNDMMSAANRIAELEAQLLGVLQRETATIYRYDAKVEALEQRIAQLEAEKLVLRDQLLASLGSIPKDYPDNYSMRSHGAWVAWHRGIQHAMTFIEAVICSQIGGAK